VFRVLGSVLGLRVKRRLAGRQPYHRDRNASSNTLLLFLSDAQRTQVSPSTVVSFAHTHTPFVCRVHSHPHTLSHTVSTYLFLSF